MPHLWYPGCQINENQNPYGPIYTLKASGTFHSASLSSPQSFTLPNSYSTSAGDCITVACCVNANSYTGGLSGSGCGATWTDGVSDSFFAGISPMGGFIIGWGCTGGGTTFTLTQTHWAGVAGAFVIAVWSGVKSVSTPIQVCSPSNNSGTATVTATTSAATSANQLIVGMAGASTTTGTWVIGTPPSWTNGPNTNNIAIDNNGQAIRSDAAVTPGNAGNLSVLYTAAGAAQLRAAILVLNHA